LAAVDRNLALVRLSESTNSDFGKVDFAIQSDPQKVFSSIWQLESQVNNGGFDAYFRHTDPKVIAHAPVALKEIGALQCCAVVERALQFLEPVRSTLKGQGDNQEADDAVNALDALDQEFFAYPDNLTELLFAFVAKRPEAFGPVS